jgi:hypothetical protein
VTHPAARQALPQAHDRQWRTELLPRRGSERVR